MDIKDIDLNLLIIFQQLLQERRVSAVAVNLGLSQPTISNALNRLRQQLGDELFLRTSKGMEPTSYAMQLAEPIGYALSIIHETLNQRTGFDPASSQRKFIVGMNDIGEIGVVTFADRAQALLVDYLREKYGDACANLCRDFWTGK